MKTKNLINKMLFTGAVVGTLFIGGCNNKNDPQVIVRKTEKELKELLISSLPGNVTHVIKKGDFDYRSPPISDFIPDHLKKYSKIEDHGWIRTLILDYESIEHTDNISWDEMQNYILKSNDYIQLASALNIKTNPIFTNINALAKRNMVEYTLIEDAKSRRAMLRERYNPERYSLPWNPNPKLYRESIENCEKEWQSNFQGIDFLKSFKFPIYIDTMDKYKKEIGKTINYSGDRLERLGERNLQDKQALEKQISSLVLTSLTCFRPPEYAHEGKGYKKMFPSKSPFVKKKKR